MSPVPSWCQDDAGCTRAALNFSASVQRPIATAAVNLDTLVQAMAMGLENSKDLGKVGVIMVCEPDVMYNAGFYAFLATPAEQRNAARSNGQLFEASRRARRKYVMNSVRSIGD